MTIQAQDAVIGRLMREKQANAIHKSALEAETKRVGKFLETLGQKLQRDPMAIQLEGRELTSDHLGTALWITQPETEAVNNAIQLADEYREAVRDLRQIAQQLAEAGLS